ncbi:PEGA domain-containing protein [Methanoplanus endosymbiosus]|uniref:PEGA domain-containing protein n=1 Tax=Methanoplanus endosymbiosus TaxID=33865 RepID=A0A9E7PMP8_9EURY|nr:PEGA domain-containing protein [Methanoplanus endosymbiosus]UUX93063.1 PEGA domain-containing protein [Methanoplanus endosymbiosus]
MSYKSFTLITIISLIVISSASATTNLEIIKYAEDGSTVLGKDSADYSWMEQNLPVKGDGRTHYYLQGPVFEAKWSEVHPDLPYDMWNPQEDINYEGKDLGAVKGTSLRDICNLAGGMNEGDIVRVQAQDGFYKNFPYENVYSPTSAQGEIIVAWYSVFDDGRGGYVPADYSSGMRLAFLADTSVNPTGDHVFGVTDMKDSLPDEYCHYFNGQYPATTGLSVQGISKIIIYSDDEAPPGKITVTSEPKGAEVYLNDEYMGKTDITIEDLDDGDYEVTVKLDGYKTPDPKSASVTLASETVLEFVLEENFSGYSGDELKRFKKSEVKGNLNICYSENQPYILSQGKTKEITLNTGISDYENVTYSRLWVYAGDSHNRNDNSGAKPEISLTAGGKKLMAEAEYYDRKDDGDREYSATFAYTPDLSGIKNPEIKIEISNAGTANEEFTLYGIALLTEDKSGNDTTFWEGYEGCDIIWPGYETGDGSYYSYADTDSPDSRISEAKATCIATGMKNPSPEDVSFEFNGEEWSEIFTDEDYGLLNRTFDVFLFLDGRSATTGIKSSTSSSEKGYIEARNLIFSGIINEDISSTSEPDTNLTTTDKTEPEDDTEIFSKANKSADLTGDNYSKTNSSQPIYPDYCDRCTGYREEKKSLLDEVIDLFFRLFSGSEPDNPEYDCDLCVGFNESRIYQVNSTHIPENDTETYNENIYENKIISVESEPQGALIYINGTYTGKITPYRYESDNIYSKTLTLEKEGFRAYNLLVSREDETIRPVLTPSDSHISEKSLHSVKNGNETVSETGSLYVKGSSEDLMVFIDNRNTFKKTPEIISGIKTGVHTIYLKSYDDFSGSSDSYGSRKIYVYENCITPVFIPDSEKYSGKVSFVSDDYNGKPASVNGIYQRYSIPFTSDEIYYDRTYLCIDDENKYISYYIPADSYVEGKFVIPEYEGNYYNVFFDSEPQGADIFIDGFDTGYHTPFQIENISAGHHKAVISKPGYIPEEKEFMVHAGEEDPSAGSYHFSIEEYPSGSVFADTIPSGAKVYLNDVNTGAVTPVTIPYLNIGTYKIRFINGSVRSGLLDITVLPFEKTEIIEDMQ